MTVDNAGNVYMYDAEGRVTQANDGSYVTTYTYDGNGQRVGASNRPWRASSTGTGQTARY